MAGTNYKPNHYHQDTMMVVNFEQQILPGTFEHALHHLIEHHLCLKPFEAPYKNQYGGASAYHPRVLLKIILFAYSKGIMSSRRMAELCRTNVQFMALSGDSHPHFTTLADFVSSRFHAIKNLFLQVVWACDEQGLIGKEMFAIDGCKLSSNASKKKSGTRADFQRKVQKLDTAIERMLTKHQSLDKGEAQPDWLKAEQQQIETLKKQAEQYTRWLSDNPDDKRGPSGNIHKSNITDPDSAKMKDADSVKQGYIGVGAVDAKTQILVDAQAFGQPQEHHLLKPVVESLKNTFTPNHSKGHLFQRHGTKLTADAGYSSKDNAQWLEDNEIDGYIADTLFRKRDPRFIDAERYKPQQAKSDNYTQADFQVDLEQKTCRCPVGHSLYLKNQNFQIGGRKAIAFMARQSDCGPCPNRSRCLKDKDQKSPRQIHIFLDNVGRGHQDDNALQRMKHKIDTDAGRQIYGQRLGTVEPVFGNIQNKGMRRFTLRGKDKVQGQWRLMGLVHNIEKLQKYAPGLFQ